MIFSSSLFLFIFLPILLCVYYLSAEKYKNMILLIASLIFYAWGEPKNVLIMLLSITVNYMLGIWIEEYISARKVFLMITIIYNIGILFIFKYLNFGVEIFNVLGGGRKITIPQITLPIGISFYTFQTLSYVVDVYRGHVKAQRKLLNLALYVSLFPQLIAGPIVRYKDVESQINRRETSLEKMYVGIIRFAIGFSKKILLADQLAVLVDIIFAREYPSIIASWIGIIAYTLQIFFDFSGYSDMAIGLGKMFGFDFLENFDYPYMSKTIKEFWRRWHMSLGTWFRDYLYIPLGGSKRGRLRTYINLFVVFSLTGLWHGASFNFIVWGGFYAILLIIERIGLGKIFEKLPVWMGHIYSIFAIMIGWVFFRSDGLESAINYFLSMFVPTGRDIANFNFIMNGKYWACIIIGIFFSMPHIRLKAFIEEKNGRFIVYNFGIIIMFLIAICYMVGSGYSPFLYFRF